MTRTTTTTKTMIPIMELVPVVELELLLAGVNQEFEFLEFNGSKLFISFEFPLALIYRYNPK